MDRFRNSWLRGASAAFLSLSLFVLLGCSGSSGGENGAIVEGKVTVDGTPATAGEVIFTVGTQTVSGPIQADGTYRAFEVPVGEAKVIATSPPQVGPRLGAKIEAKMKESDMPRGATTVVPIPAKYNRIDSSGLTLKVKSGRNTYDLALTK